MSKTRNFLKFQSRNFFQFSKPELSKVFITGIFQFFKTGTFFIFQNRNFYLPCSLLAMGKESSSGGDRLSEMASGLELSLLPSLS